MPVITLVSAKGSPGVTTTAATLATIATCAGEPAWWIELDPSGGSGWVRSRQSCPDSEATLADVARDLRESDAAVDEWKELAVAAPPDVRAVLAPSAPRAAASVIAEGPERWAASLRAQETVVVDAGRWSPRQQTASRIVGSDVVVAVCKSTVESVEHVRHWVPEVRQVARCPVVTIVVGTQPYSGDEVAAATGLPLAGVVEWRRSDVAALWDRGANRAVQRSWLGRSAARALAGVLEVATRPTGRGLAERVRQGDDRHPDGARR